MKVKKFSKIAFLSLMTAMLMLMMSYITAGASDEVSEDAPAPLDIAYCNLSFENEVHLMYAISSADENVKLLLWEEAQTEYIKGTETAVLSPLTEKMTIDGEEYTIFKYTGLSAKQMTDNVYVRAYIDGSKEYGTAHKYSILQYVYNKLGKTGTASTNEAFKNMLTEMLEYGAATQAYQNYNTDALATDDFVQIKIEGGILPDGFSHGLYKVGSTLTITAPETDADGVKFVEWVNENGNAVADTATAEITVEKTNMTYSASYNAVTYSRGLELTLNDDGESYSVTGIGSCTDSDLRIPPTYEAKPITTINEKAFMDCSNIKSITITANITSIGMAAFACSSLENIYIYPQNSVYHVETNCLIETASKTLIAGCKNSIIPSDNSVTNIGMGAFAYCTGITSIELPDTIMSIGDYAFPSCDNLTNIEFSQNIESIGFAAFHTCINLVNIEIPDSVTSIGAAAFYNCRELESVNIGNGVKGIGAAAFAYCEKLRSVVIGNSVTEIGLNAFLYCANLTSIEIPSSVTSIDSSAFSDCYKLVEVFNNSSVDIPKKDVLNIYSQNNGSSKLHTVNDYIFYEDDEVIYLVDYIGDEKQLILPENYSGLDYSIYQYAFYKFYEITDISIPASVMNIGYKAFLYCRDLNGITVDENNTVYHSKGDCLIETLTGTLIAGSNNSIIPSDGSVTSIDNYAFATREGLVNIVIPDSVTKIGDYAFQGCKALVNVTISNSVTSLGQNIFHSCPEIKNITFTGTTSEWLSIYNESYWYYVDSLTVYCSDGTVSKDGTVIPIS